MIKVPVKKLHHKDLEILQTELEIYVQYVAGYELKKEFLNSIITFDLAQNLYYIIRNRLEKNGEYHTVYFTASQAAIVLKCCNLNRTDRDEFTKHVMNKLKINLDQQLINLV